MSTQPFVREISVDYSDDELDALATAFGRKDLARRPERSTDDPIRRAQRQTALRGLVARHAIMLSGTPNRPQIAFLDPHATLLGTWLRAPAVATIRTEAREAARSASLLVGDEVVVHQAALPGQAIQRLTAHGRDGAPDLLAAELDLASTVPAPEDAKPIEVSPRMVGATLEAFEQGQAPPTNVPKAAVDVLHARLSSGSLTIAHRATGGVRVAERWAWIDAGTLGLWRVRGPKDGAVLTIEPFDPSALRTEIADTWSGILDGTA
ncbi:MAG: hypothetical protein PGN13_00040 [Patulibacter minatonensis]